MRVSAQHQRISDKGDAPAPCSNLAQPEPISPGSNRCKRYDGGLCRERLPGGTQKTLALSIDRHGTGESYDCPSRKKDERGDVAVTDQMHYRPEADPRQEWMTGDPDDPLRRLREASFLGDGGRVRCRQAN